MKRESGKKVMCKTLQFKAFRNKIFDNIIMSRHRDYVFTIFSERTVSLSLDLKEKCLKDDKVQYAIVGTEICPHTKRLHLQGYISFKNAKSGSALQKYTGGGKHHYQVRKGKPHEARDYCWKGPSSKRTAGPHKKAVYWEVGDLPTGQGARTDIIKTKESLENGANLRNIITETTSTQSINYALKWMTYFEKKRDWKPNVKWFYGETGSGKTRKAMADTKDPYVVNESNKWWDGYDGHEDVIFDDLRSDFCSFHILLRLLDRYEMRVEVKGGFRQLLAKNIIITSAFHPTKLFGETQEDTSQLTRRIDEIIEFKIAQK